MSVGPTLLEIVCGLLERTYRVESGLSGIAPFVIGDLGYRELYGEKAWRWVAGSPAGARTLVRESEGQVAVCIYFPDALIDRLERKPPQAGVGEENVREFAEFVEEIDHLLLIAERSRADREVRLFELELHANVSKYLVLARFLGGASGRLDAARRAWLEQRMFAPGGYCDEDPEVRSRYERAAHWGGRMVRALGRLDPAVRVDELRRFHEASGDAQLEQIRCLER